MSTRQTLARARSWQRLQNRTANDAKSEARRLWLQADTLNFVSSWQQIVPRLFAVVVGAQLVAGREANQYVDQTLGAQDLDTSREGFEPDSLSGVAADGSDLLHTLMWPAWAAVAALAGGSGVGRARAVGAAAAELTTATQVQDAFRTASSVAAAAKPSVRDWTRALTPPSCSRCIVLAGDYSWSTAFQRHPRCDCTAIPTSSDSTADLSSLSPKAYFDGLSESEQDQVFGAAGAQAIRDGADIGRVVNARRKAAGISTAAGSQLGMIRQQGILDQVKGLDGDPLITFSRTSGQDRRDKRVRVMPETIYQVADSRDHAIDLLKANGYITEDWRDRLMRVRGFV